MRECGEHTVWGRTRMPQVPCLWIFTVYLLCSPKMSGDSEVLKLELIRV